jgi:release factor glutamine methyltransferase
MNSDLKEWTVLSMLEWATGFFKDRDIPDPRHSIEWLLAETLSVKRLDLYLSYDRPLSTSELSTLRPLVKRRARHEPLQYITGYSEFMNARINLTPEVLIPRIETEQLVEIILDDHPAESSLRGLDIGTGSGCIPVALKMERPTWDVSAVDISEDALAVARKNAEHNNVDISYAQGDITLPESLSFSDSFDIIVSNPPYILPDEKEGLENQVKKHEPVLALFCDNIEDMYQHIIRYARNNLVEKGTLYLEINANFSAEILALFDANSWDAMLLKDYDKKDRFIAASIKS